VKPLKVLSVIGTRPEIIRMSRILAAFESCPAIDSLLVHTGQNYDHELNQVFFDDLGIKKPDFLLGAAGKTPAETIGLAIARMDAVLAEAEPDAFVVLGDTNSALTAIAAKKRRVPIFHLEAGNRCFDERVPEEANRRLVDHISDVNLCYSDIARSYLLAEGLPPDRVIKTGSPMFEVIGHAQGGLRASTALEDLGLTPQGFFLMSFHREENVGGENFFRIVAICRALDEAYGLPVIVSTHPRTRQRARDTGAVFPAGVRLLAPLGFYDYLRLETEALAVISDSGTISEEASILNFPAVNLREAHERPEATEETPVIMTGLDPDSVLRAVAVLSSQRRGPKRDFHPVRDYTVDNVAAKVVRIVLSYTGYVDRVVWRRDGR
jgi:UDP-N-acetyl-L-fucosamine synthase